jgi:predicted alpha/beta superfamily hydrolase
MLPSSVKLPNTAWWDMPAGSHPMHSHRIYLAWPEEPPPPEGYPVLMILDANAGFATAVDAYRALRWRTTSARPLPALILGLGHPGDAAYDPPARMRDYAPPSGIPGDHPGGGAFLRFIEKALLPELARRYPVDPGRLALFGHSLGGLFALHALFSRPGLFHRLVAASPSLWWGEGRMIEAARHFTANPPAAAIDTRLLVTVGGLEECGDGPRGALRAGRRMISNARALAASLRDAGLASEFVEFPNEDHGSVRLHALIRSLSFTLSPA